MSPVARNLTDYYGYFYCWTFDPCETLKCIDDRGEGGSDLYIIKCNKPPAVRYIYRTTRDEVLFDHTFTYSESVSTNYSGFQFQLIWNGTLVHLDNGIGFEVGCKGMHIYRVQSKTFRLDGNLIGCQYNLTFS